MAEFLIQDTTLIGIADEVRTLSGTEGAISPTTMKTDLHDANAEVSDQADLL